MAVIPTLHALGALPSLFSQATTVPVELLRATSSDSPLVAFLSSSTALLFCVIFRSSVSQRFGLYFIGDFGARTWESSSWSWIDSYL
jgi:hypothetical protein